MLVVRRLVKRLAWRDSGEHLSLMLDDNQPILQRIPGCNSAVKLARKLTAEGEKR